MCVAVLGPGQIAAALSRADAAKFDRLIEQAAALETKGDLKGAEAKMTEAISLAPGEPSAYYNRARFRARAGELAGAEQDIDMYLAMNAADTDGHELSAHIRMRRNDAPGALAAANETLRRDDNRDGARMMRAQVLQALGHYSEALKDYERLLRTRPDNDQVLAGRAECELNLGNNSAAKLALQKLSQKHPENSWAHYMLGRANFALQAFPEAITNFRRALELKSEPAETLKWIGYCQFAGRADQEAIATLKEAIAARPAVSPYAYLVLHVAIRRAERSVSESPLQGAFSGWKDEWAQALGRYLLGTLGDQALVDQAKAVKDQQQRDGMLCEAYYYIGATRQLEMDSVASEVLFERVLGTRRSAFVEFTFARAELKR